MKINIGKILVLTAAVFAASFAFCATDVNGGAFDSKRTECRTELKGVGRNPAQGYHNVGFRVVRVDWAVFL